MSPTGLMNPETCLSLPALHLSSRLDISELEERASLRVGSPSLCRVMAHILQGGIGGVVASRPQEKQWAGGPPFLLLPSPVAKDKYPKPSSSSY